MKSKQRAETVAEAIELVYDSLVSHLEWTHKASSEGEKFHKQCVREYAVLIRLLADLFLMTPDKETLLANIKMKVLMRLDEKFRAGDKEHQDDIRTIKAADEAFDELIDALVYVYLLLH